MSTATNPSGIPTASGGDGPAAWRSHLTRLPGGNALLMPSRATVALSATREPHAGPGSQWQPPGHSSDRWCADAPVRRQPCGTRQCERRTPPAGTPPQPPAPSPSARTPPRYHSTPFPTRPTPMVSQCVNRGWGRCHVELQVSIPNRNPRGVSATFASNALVQMAMAMMMMN